MFQKIKTYDIIVQANDHGTPSLSSTAAVTLNIVDKNSHSPMFKEKKVHIFEILLQLLLVLWLLLLTLPSRVMCDLRVQTVLNVQYKGAVNESNVQDNILRVAVDDLDTPKTPGWRAKYFFIKGNEDGSYKIETDPDTNEGVLSVIKVKFSFSQANRFSIPLQWAKLFINSSCTIAYINLHFIPEEGF